MGLTNMVARRFGQGVVVLFLVSIIVFTLEHLLPGGPARALLGARATPTSIRAFNIQNGLQGSLISQYFHWLDHLLRGNLGFSFQQNEPVNTLLGQRLPKTLLLTGVSTALAVLIAAIVGALQAARHNKLFDHLMTAISFTLYSMPTFWLALLLVEFLAVQVHAFPAEAPQGSLGNVLSHPRGMVLPVATLTFVTLAAFSRYVRSSVLEELAQDYVRAARARGASSSRRLWAHALRNSLIPMVTLVGLSLPAIVGGAVVVEVVFNYPGMGLLFFNAATSDDYAVLLGVAMVTAAATVVGSLLADVLYAVVDPRVRDPR
jgi:peptide/nickel transport system permease protein